MPIAVNPEHNDLADSVRSFVARVAPSDVLHQALETPIPNPPPYWKAAAEQGLQGVHLAEAVGGQGFGILELAIVLAEFGYGAVPGPFVPSAIASALISAHDPKAALLNELASGEIIAAYAIDSGLTATRHGDGLVIRGEVRAVPAAEQASVLVLPVSIDSGEEWVVLDSAQLEIEPVQSIDPLRPLAHVRANAVEVGDDRVLSNLSRPLARALMSTLLSAEAVGVSRWATDTASAYAKIREQFGRPIGQFQAIKHKCAEMIADTERATAAVWDAARAIDESRQSDPDDSAFEFAAAVAATLAPVAAQRCAQDCIQVHGGIGFTWEHDTNIYYRRALLLAACFGRAADYPQQVVDIATTTGMRKLNIDLDPETEKLREEIRAEVAGLKALPRGAERNAAIAEGGWVQPHLPKPWGRASDPVEQIIIAQEFSTGRVKRPQMGIAAWIIPSIVAFGTDEQKQKFLPPTFRGEMIWCQLFSEPGAGSDLAGLSTKATKVDGGWRITGQKIWTTAAQYSQWGALLARTDPSAPKHNGITYFLLDMKSEGVEVKPLRELTGNAMFNTVFIDDVFVPDEFVLGEVNRGWEVSRNTLTAERVSIGSSEPPGMASLDGLVEFIRDGQFDQISQNRAGRLIAEGHAAKILNMRSTLLTLAGGDPMPAAAISKLLSMRTGQGYAEFAVSSFGTDGAIGDPESIQGKWAEHLLYSRATTIYGGTTEVQLNIIAERLLGLPRDP
ncbi:acyl-CoA dehydrogenase [Mycolicibacterium sp. 120270]|uniref:acyl-CoA dehydrogenase n=1 Tax=Mycolicibacterium sp. 120270 TaxID=3090600 RepID=UPI00299DE7FF|nr:acyl-CoA dehydrogenase [Mycolicibacterium sp. 120270]MDX1885706.1 acyl-CoA dehydrogenase [Mycolicibacterium sp. 120270]